MREWTDSSAPSSERERERFGIVAGRVIRRRTGNLFPQRSRLNVSGGVPSLAIAPLPLQLCGRWAGISLCQPLYSVNKKQTNKQRNKKKRDEHQLRPFLLSGTKRTPKKIPPPHPKKIKISNKERLQSTESKPLDVGWGRKMKF